MNFIVSYDNRGSNKQGNAKSKVVVASNWERAKEQVESSGNIVNMVVNTATGNIEYEKID